LLSDGKQIGTVPTSVNFGGKRKHRNITYIQGVVVPSIGEFEVRFVVETKIVAKWVIRIDKVTRSQAQPTIKKASVAKSGG
jgi:hypothetical protein